MLVGDAAGTLNFPKIKGIHQALLGELIAGIQRQGSAEFPHRPYLLPVGKQPVAGFDVVLSLVGYVVVYLIMFSAGVALMARIVRSGPAEPALEPEPVESGRPLQPVQALPSHEGSA